MRPSHQTSLDPPRGSKGPVIIGNSPVMERVRQQVAVAARYDEPVLILGETGSGKELAARSIHALGNRARRPFAAVNCAGVTSETLASELFGHRAGAFTGATRDRRGRLRAAHGSTVLLDELSETDRGFQAAILRTIDTGEVQPLGEDRVEHVDVRFLATSNRPPDALAAGRHLRSDLLHRIAAFVIEVPPLRERREDLLPLSERFLARLEQKHGVARKLSPGALDLLCQYSFPGNVRELMRVLTRAYASSADEHISPARVADALDVLPHPQARLEDTGGDTPADMALQSIIRSHIRRAIAMADRNLSEAARLLQIPRSTLQHYLTKYDIEPAAAEPTGRREAR